MSLFKVKICQTRNTLDTSMVNGYSTQRTITITDENGVESKYRDGAEFEGSNYFLQFCQPQMTAEDAFLLCLENDGTISKTNMVASAPVVINETIGSIPVYIDLVKKYGGPAQSFQITNRSKDELKVKLNCSDNAVLSVFPMEQHSFDINDGMVLTSLEFINESNNLINVQFSGSIAK